MTHNNFSIMVIAALFAALHLVGCSSDEDVMEVVSNSIEESSVETVTLPSGHVITKSGDENLWQEDILLTDYQVNLLSSTGSFFEDGDLCEPTRESLLLPAASGATRADILPISRSCAVYPNANLWAMVRFVYAPTGSSLETQLSSFNKNLIQQALRYWEAHTNVRFYNATGQPTHDDTYNIDYPYIYFCNGDGNNSYVGRVGGQQKLHLKTYFATVGTAIHEIGHAIGLYHEQCRFDRDNYVTVNLSNVESKDKSNFTKITKNYYCMGDFDFNSIMLYSSYDFAIDPTVPTITKKDGSTFIGQRDSLSNGDRKFPNYFYLPYIARSDTYAELDTIMYDGNNNRLTKAQILQIQAQLNNGNATPPSGGRISNDF